ncbi:hypothetical protein [Micromonospora pisi]|nr:hypothetical protein [Micromonospora pisi]
MIDPVAVDTVSRQWRVGPDDRPDSPWLVPAQPLRLRLAEPPITLR